jgi:dTDP-4-amino-4,6-dideoxy-D-galactose acyltransferase
MIKVAFADIKTLSNDEVSNAFEIMRHAYRVTEAKIWGDMYSRIGRDEFVSFIKREEIILARIDGKIVGSIYTYRLRENVFSFGLLSADFDKKGLGIGRKLIVAAENHALKSGAEYMEIEILRAKNFDIPSKVMLHEWYLRQGYSFLESEDFVARKPKEAKKATRLLVPSVFDCYRKLLS